MTGPESSGKSFLAKELSDITKGTWVREFARKYLETKSSYEQKDLFNIATGQKEWERREWGTNSTYVFSDTGIEVICIWSEVKYGNVDPKIMELLNLNSYDDILLCKPNIPWQDDPLREHPQEREFLFEKYQEFLRQKEVAYIIIDAPLKKRVQQALGFLSLI